MKFGERHERDKCKCGRDKIVEKPICCYCKRRAWAKNNPDRVNFFNYKWRMRNPEKMKAIRDRYVTKKGEDAVKEIIMKWRKEHPENCKAIRAKSYKNRRRYILTDIKRKTGREAIKKMIKGWAPLTIKDIRALERFRDACSMRFQSGDKHEKVFLLRENKAENIRKGYGGSQGEVRGYR